MSPKNLPERLRPCVSATSFRKKRWIKPKESICDTRARRMWVSGNTWRKVGCSWQHVPWHLCSWTWSLVHTTIHSDPAGLGGDHCSLWPGRLAGLPIFVSAIADYEDNLADSSQYVGLPSGCVRHHVDPCGTVLRLPPAQPRTSKHPGPHIFPAIFHQFADFGRSSCSRATGHQVLGCGSTVSPDRAHLSKPDVCGHVPDSVLPRKMVVSRPH